MKSATILSAAVLLPVLMGLGCREKNETKIEHHHEETGHSIYGSGFELASCDQITEPDIRDLCERIRHKDPEEFEAIMLTNKFHQHIGPNNIYGAKMALYAKKLLGGKDHEISVLSEAGTRPPVSCLNDGIMCAIGATFGRGLIQVAPDSSKLAATFSYNGKAVRLEVRPEKLAYTRKVISDSRKKYGGLTDDYFKDVRKTGLHAWENYAQDDLFLVSYPDNASSVCEFSKGNVNSFYNRLHEFLHSGPSNDEIISFIESDPCVARGSIETEGNEMLIVFYWKSNNEKLVYAH
ncbi:MAG: hypothetical protein GF418_13625 [Chitinivibrionales bacterium]|nr:hypothetical protein [Chitinivibrionales bacterium]MBD3396660.1 hypothetical protein [Chitinivibrionales bacterium]